MSDNQETAKYYCRKCGGDNIFIRYLDGLDKLACKCQRCEYRWNEEPKDRINYLELMAKAPEAMEPK